MAASGGNIEWSTTVKPILTSIYGPFFEKNDIIEVIQAIVKSENEFSSHSVEHDLFYTCFACLSAHFIYVNANSLTPEHLGTARDAIKIILKHILKKLSDQAGSECEENEIASACVSSRLLLLSITVLFTPEGPSLSHNDQIVLVSLLNCAILPTCVTTSDTSSKGSSQASTIATMNTSAVEKTSSTTNTRRSDALLEQLTLPLQAQTCSQMLDVLTPLSPSKEDVKEGSSTQSIDKWIDNICPSLLIELKAGSVILKVCQSLPCLQRYLLRWKQAKETNQPPYQTADTLIHSLAMEVNICQLALALPCLEPLTPDRIVAITDITVAWLLCAVTQAINHSKDEEMEQLTGALVESALVTYRMVGGILKNSPRAGGYVYQNHLMMGGWVLVCGLQSMLNCSDGASKTPRVRSSSRLGSVCGAACVALGSVAARICRRLLCAARVEALASTAEENAQTHQPAALAALPHFTALERALRITQPSNIHQLFVLLAVSCYRKATSLKQQQDTAQEQNPTAYCKDMLLMSEEDDSDDADSEPIWGLWFESTLVAPEWNEQSRPASETAPQENQPGVAFVPYKADPISYIQLGTEVLVLLAEEMVSPGCERLGISSIQLQDSHASLMAALVKDLDSETARTDTGAISPAFGQRLGALYASFSSALMRYLRGLVGSEHFDDVKAILVIRLKGGSPLNQKVNYTPLQMGCRAASIVAGVTLSSEAMSRETQIMSHWQKIIHTLTECALSSQPQPDHDYEDLNVEHAQLLVYLFHSLTLMQKKSILLTTANAVIKISETLRLEDASEAAKLAPNQLLLSTRLMLLIEYLMRHLYDPPTTLLQQVEWNLLKAPGLSQTASEAALSFTNLTVDTTPPKSRIYCAVPHIEDAYRKLIEDDKTMRPKFYALTSAEATNQETPKFDGLACNFVLGTPHKLKYPVFIDALLSFLNCLAIFDNYSKPSAQLRAAAHYTFQTTWRLVISMPPSIVCVDKLSAGKDAVLEPPFPLNFTIWAPRADQKKVFNPWWKDALVKQGMYTQYAENLLIRVTEVCDNLDYAAWLASNTIKHLRSDKGSQLLKVISCDAAVLRYHLLLSDGQTATKAEKNYERVIVPDLLLLLETALEQCRVSTSAELKPLFGNEPEEAVANMRLLIYGVGQSSDGIAPKLSSWLRFTISITAATFLELESVLNNNPTADFHAFYSEPIPSETAVLAVVSAHCEALTSAPEYSPSHSFRLLAYSAAKLLFSISSTIKEDPKYTADTLKLIIPAITDGRLQFLNELLMSTLNVLVPTPLTAEQLIIEHVLRTTYPVLLNNLSPETENVLRYVIKYWEKVLDRQAGRGAFEAVFGDEKSDFKLGEILLSAPKGNHAYSDRVVKLFNKIFSGCENSEISPALCKSICTFIGISEQERLSDFLSFLCTANPVTASVENAPLSPTEDPITPIASDPAPTPSNGEASKSDKEATDKENDKRKPELAEEPSTPIKAEENANILASLTKHIVLHDATVARTRVLAGLRRACGGRAPTPQLFKEMVRLADAQDGSAHSVLFPAAVQWMQYCVESLSAQDTLDMLGDIDAPKPPQLESATVLLAYLTDALYAISPISPNRAISPTCETPSEMNLDIDCDDMMDDDDASADDSDEEVALQNRLCSFTVTAREFMNQHWYHCHTCKMVDGVGVCTVCALVCHKGHDVTYAKFGNFFCDCGAKPDGSCKALVKRAGNSANGTMGGVRDDAPAPSIRRRASSPAPPPPPPTPRKPTLATNLQGSRAYLSSFSGWSVCLAGVERLLGALTEPCRASAEGGAAVGAHTRAARALQMLHLGEKQFVNTDHLMMPTIGSQEGAFENVRMSYTGEDGHTIRQLISGHKLRRVAMCCLASPHGRRQHLAVSHEKGKITVLQLSALLKQADTSKHKLTLTRLSSAPIPFTVLTLSGNACNEDLLAVCGLKDCHVLSFNSSGTVSEHFVVNIKLEAGNYIVKAIWLPGSQTQLAIVTSDFIKIFDLAKNLIDPTYHFLVPSGKIRDATFVWQDDAMNMLCMSSSGHINYQPMTEDTLATNGPFYITNTLQILHPEIQDFDGLVCNGGTSIYYSHTLKIMFFSYQGGKSFLAPLSRVEESVKGVALIPLTAANNARGESIRKAAVQGLSGWAEVPGHPGLVTAVTHAGNSPVVFMLTPTSILIQEVKVVPTKAKITDMVAVRHASGATGTEQKTTLMLLCEDGSLRMYTASAEKTGFWLSSAVQPRMRKRAPPTHAHKPMVTKSNSSGEPQFPVDFFEHCVVLSDIEIGGNDLLQVYNVAQIKHRLNTIGLYVVATNEFTMELTQPDAFKVITGVRILIGTQDVARAPTYIEIGGRTIPTKVGARSRWFDIPLTREETLQFANKLTVKFGPSQDPEGVIMVDSVKVYGKDKDQFGWPEETEESATCASTSKVQQDNNVTGWQPTTIETVACGALEVLELGASGVGVGAGSGAGAEAARRLLTAAAAPLLITRSQALLRALYHQNYHVQKDQTILSYVMEELLAMVTTADPRNIDPEAYVRVILLARAVAISRPQHLVKFSPNTPVKPADGDWGSIWMGRHVIRHPAALAAATAWRLASVRDPLPAAPVAAGGLRHRDHALHALIDVLHAFATHSDANMVEFVNHIYLSFLLSEEQSISFGAKAAVMRVLRPRVKRRRAHIPSPPNTPANPVRPIPVAESIATTSHDENQQFVDVDDPMEPMVLLAPGGALEGLLDIPPDADDETMVELAIALSLQEQPRAAAAAPARYSDTTASAPGSDDEGSTAATDGSTLRTSPADAAGSDSGGSGADSIGGVSGRSSAYGEMISAPSAGAIAAAAAAVQAPIAETTAPESETQRLHALRLTLLTAALNQLPTLRTLPGQRAIPLMQVVLMIAGELDTSVEAEKVLLDKLLDILLTELDMENESGPVAHIRTNQRELRLVLMRLLSVLMARWKTAASAGGACGVPRAETAAAGVSRATASALVKHQAPAYCLRVLSQLLPYWKNKALETTPPVPGQQLLRPQPPQPLPDMQPFFVKEYVKGHALDVFDNYPQLLMEMALRLPCQIHKHCDPTQFDSKWKTLLCEYMMNPQTPLRKQVRKLLLLLCGSRERYRQLRDIHALDTHLAAARDLLDRKRDLVYDDLVVLTEHLKACSETVTARTGNWQQVCGWERSGTLAWLIKAAVRLNAGVAPSMLSLLHSALAIPTANAPKAVASSTAVAAVPAASSSAEAAAEREKSAESDAYNSDSSKFHEAKVPHLVQLIQKQVSQEEFGQFVRVFLLEANSTAMRWKAHALILAIYNNSTPEEQLKLVELMWSIWPSLPQYGRRAAQFVDLIGYFTIKTPNIDSEKYLSMGVELLKSQNEKLSTHPNGALYSTLSNFVEIDGYYLESEPCLVCNNPETPMANIKLPTIKIDSKFTTTTQIVKLVSSHMISRISLRIGDIKRSKMVRTINFFYNNRSVQAVQELKNKPGMWQKAKKVVLQSGQTDVKVDFPLPIVACNLMMEYADFYENQQASGESLQCPRCSASVPANPGVCANCGENVFQCHKCRAINYDEKDPFLCHACGFCKYAKFDYSLTARPCCAVDTIENDDDRKKMLANIGNLLDKADRAYRQLVANKPQLEALVHKISSERVGKVGATADESGTNSNVHRAIQALAHKYCSDTKGHFDDLSKIIQKVLACRKELVAYDRSQSEQLKGDSPPAYTGTLNSEYGTYSKGGGCYGCSLASSEFCVLVLRALASQPQHRPPLWRLGLVSHLVQHNLMRPSEQEATRALVCLVTRDNIEATESVCNEVSRRVMLALLGRATDRALRPLVSLLGALLAVPDAEACWEVRLKTVLRLWIWCSPQLTEVAGIPPFAATILKSDIGIEGIPGLDTSTCPNAQQNALHQVALPCLRYMQQLTSPAELPASVSTTNTTDAELKPTDWGAKTISCWWSCGAGVSLGAWIAGDVKSKHTSRLAPPEPSTAPGERDRRDTHLATKYVAKWRRQVLMSHGMQELHLDEAGWLRQLLFDPSSRHARATAAQMLRSLCDSYDRTKEVLLLLNTFLPDVSKAGEASEQYLELYQSLASISPWKQFLALHGVLKRLADLMTKEIEQLHKLEETTLTSDMSQGYALKRLVELLALLLEEPGARRVYKTRLVGAVLGGYLALRRLVVQRTRLTDDTQNKLLELLEEMTTGTEAETAEFMAVCIETVRKYPMNDYRTPVFIFERLCSIIYPEEDDVGEFFLTLEKDPQQEDFLSGRMLGNPYSSTEPGLGPLMRDVKNKICTDCDLVALLEDDNAMELLVCNKIMSLDLPVKDVYKKVWSTSSENSDTMRVVYRIRGLHGDATEEFVETLNAACQEEQDDEKTYRMANVLADCGGLEVLIARLASVQSASGGAARALLSSLLRLVALCVRVVRCARGLARPHTRAMSVLLRATQLVADDEKDLPRPELTIQLLEIMERILTVAASESLESFLQFSLTFGGPEYVQALLNCTEMPGIRNNPVALGHLTRVLAALVYGNDLKMAMLCEHFKPVFDFDKLDSEHLADEEFRMELFCVLCANIERNAIGGTLKDYLISLGIVRDALQYITKNAPCVKPTLVCTDSAELKEFISRPALKYILRFLTGLATDHEPTQMAVCEKVIPIVHRLEQVSSGEHVGSLAENLLEALRTHPAAAQKVQDARDYTRQEKKRLAMAVRERQLGALGMKSNDRGQVTAQCSFTHQLAELAEEAGAVCCICREGYKYQPTKVLGVYTFTKRCSVEDFEVRARKTMGYTTVSHYNVVHVECHMAAVRLARAREEWESAALQNASTKCNGLLPLWGPHVPESAFASCLARHTTYLQECTGHRDITHTCTIHDIKLLLLRFARNRSFHDDTGGGGPLSNMQLLPAMLHVALYVMNTSRVSAREATAVLATREWIPQRVLESAHDAEGILYYAVLMLALFPHSDWRANRLEYYRRAIITAHARAIAPSGPALRSLTPEQKVPRDFADYKPYVTFIAVIEQLYNVMFKTVTAPTQEQWPIKLAEYIRNNDEANAKAAEKIVAALTDEIHPCASFSEFCDVADLLGDISEPEAYLQELLGQLP